MVSYFTIFGHSSRKVTGLMHSYNFLFHMNLDFPILYYIFSVHVFMPCTDIILPEHCSTASKLSSPVLPLLHTSKNRFSWEIKHKYRKFPPTPSTFRKSCFKYWHRLCEYKEWNNWDIFHVSFRKQNIFIDKAVCLSLSEQK